MTLQERITILEEKLVKIEENYHCFDNLKPNQIKASKQRKCIEKKMNEVIDKLERARRQL